ncbi:MAG: hypothetical protein HZA04_06120 [Nitrospinae bacterium]|nr:hypothetical protein [Nitrospinota bacterium]
MSTALPCADNLQILVEDGFTAHGPALMADGGDRRTFSCAGPRFSLCAKDEYGANRLPLVRPDGVRNGCLVIPSASGAPDAVDVSAGTSWIGGALISVPQTLNIPLPRPAAGMMNVSSVVITGTGTIAVIAGAEAIAFSSVRGTAGGSPFVTEGQVELATVSFTASATAPVKEDELSFSPEYSHAPDYRLLPYFAQVVFSAPLRAIHTGGTARNVWIAWSEPVMTAMDALSFRAPVEQNEPDPQTLLTVRRKVRPGVMRVALTGSRADLARRIDRTTRLFELKPDAAGNRRELFYAVVETSADYRPGEIMEGELLLFAVEYPATL